MEMNDGGRQVALSVRLIYAARAPDGDLWSEHDHVHYDCHPKTISLYFNWGSLLQELENYKRWRQGGIVLHIRNLPQTCEYEELATI